MRQLQPAVDRRPAFLPDLPQPIGPHGILPLLACADGAQPCPGAARWQALWQSPGRGLTGGTVRQAGRTSVSHAAARQVRSRHLLLPAPSSGIRRVSLIGTNRWRRDPIARGRRPCQSAKAAARRRRGGAVDGRCAGPDAAGIRGARPAQGRSARRPARAVHALVRRGVRRAGAGAERHDARDGRCRRAAGGAHGAAQGHRSARPHLLHQPGQPQGARARGQRQGGAAVLVAAARAPGALRGHDRAGRRGRGRRLLRDAGRAAARSAPGRRRRAA